jgi:regulatory protein
VTERDPRAFLVSSLAAKAQSVAEMRAKLAVRGVAPADAEALLEEAARLGYLNDAELAGQLARGFRSRGYGRRRAAGALGRRGLPAPLADDALDEAYGDVDEVVLARSALGLRPLDDDAAQRRAAAFLVRRGFSSAAAWRAVRPARDE